MEDLIRMGQEEYVIENKFLSRTLEEGLSELSGKVGDPVFIRIFKEESLLEVWMRSERVSAFKRLCHLCLFRITWTQIARG